MIGREEKTVRNWAAEGRIQFAYLCSVPLVALSMVETLISGAAPTTPGAADAAVRIIGRRDRGGRRTDPERRMTRESAASSLLPSSEPQVGSTP
jgi:hypothetical protein